MFLLFVLATRFGRGLAPQIWTILLGRSFIYVTHREFEDLLCSCTLLVVINAKKED